VGIRYINDVSDWEATTASFYESVYNNDDDDVVIDNAVVEITLTNQNTKSRRKKQRRRRLLGNRMLQTAATADDTSVEVTYSQTTTYSSRDPNVGMHELMQLPLSTEEYGNAYVEELKRLEGYEDLTSVSSIATTLDEGGNNKATDGTNDAGGLSTSKIIGITCGMAAFLVLIGAVVYYRTTDKDDNDPADDGDARGITTFGLVSNSLDGPPKSTSAPTTASNSLDGPPKSSSAPTTTLRGPTLGDMSVASGDYYYPGESSDVAEELLTIYAPAGKLGIVIDSPDNGAPVIHTLKDTSPIVDKVQVGDRLVAVDDEDVRAMMAIKVSKLISRKSSSSRKLTVIRNVPS